MKTMDRARQRSSFGPPIQSLLFDRVLAIGNTFRSRPASDSSHGMTTQPDSGWLVGCWTPSFFDRCWDGLRHGALIAFDCGWRKAPNLENRCARAQYMASPAAPSLSPGSITV